ncbi:MAG: hypothetical protein M1813_004277 [Trichoglossum hirsutum]|nr:MAG: hypothetical protein M1813_004277 [Trichoglossum hirsutum]
MKHMLKDIGIDQTSHSFGALLGMQFFQTFVNGTISFRVLPRPQFASLQQALFPVYFSLQTALPVFMALTYPGTRTTAGLQKSGMLGVLAQENRFGVLLPLLTIFTTSLANLTLVDPATKRILRERKHQGKLSSLSIWQEHSMLIGRPIETHDGKKSYDNPPHSKEMVRLNKAFGRIHGTSALLNLAGFIGTLWYGVNIAEKL